MILLTQRLLQGWDSLQAGIDSAVRDDKSLPLFQKAFEKFQEVSASGQIQMGNVKLALGKRHIDRAIVAGMPSCWPTQPAVPERCAQLGKPRAAHWRQSLAGLVK